MSDPDKFLEHFGIKGMHWGVRKSGGATPVVAKKPNSTERTKYKTAPAKLSDDELTRRITRLEREKRYNDLNAKTVFKGKKLATDMLEQNGKQIVSAAVFGAGMFAVKMAIDKIWGEGTSDKVYSPGKKKKD